METHRLIPHPHHSPLAIESVEARIVGLSSRWLELRWSIKGSAKLVVPAFAGKGRTDGLWQTTCFELFLRTDGEGSYAELNLSPSERWAAYRFGAYREERTDMAMLRDPGCTMRMGRDTAIFDAAIPVGGLPARPWRAGLSAVLEEEGGRLSYWALAHPSGKPDFHHAACFAAMVPAPDAP